MRAGLLEVERGEAFVRGLEMTPLVFGGAGRTVGLGEGAATRALRRVEGELDRLWRGGCPGRVAESDREPDERGVAAGAFDVAGRLLVGDLGCRTDGVRRDLELREVEGLLAGALGVEETRDDEDRVDRLERGALVRDEVEREGAVGRGDAPRLEEERLEEERPDVVVRREVRPLERELVVLPAERLDAERREEGGASLALAVSRGQDKRTATANHCRVLTGRTSLLVEKVIVELHCRV